MGNNIFEEKLKEQGIKLSDYQCDQFEMYRKLLQEYNEKINLTAIIETDEIYMKHFYDSLIPSFHQEIKGSLLDIGAGAGFPSIPLKIIYPELEVTIIEPITKRVRFLGVLCDKLELDVKIYNERAEDHIKNSKIKYDYVTARAVASLPILAELCMPFVKMDGYFIAMKGSKAEDELKEAQHAIKVLGGSLENIYHDLLGGAERSSIFIKKTKKTPIKYPRNYGQIKKKPL